MVPLLNFKFTNTNVPINANSVAMEAFEFYISDKRGCSEDYIFSKSEHYWDILQKAINEHPKDGFITTVVSLACFRRMKFESALFFIARAIILDPHNTLASRLLIQYMDCYKYLDLEPNYFTFAAMGSGKLIEYLLEFAKSHFEKDEFMQCDFYLQRTLCLKSMAGSQPAFFSTAQQKTASCIKDGTYDDTVKQMLEMRSKMIAFEDAESVEMFTDRWLDDENKKLLAKYVAKLLDSQPSTRSHHHKRLSSKKSCIELGCHSGALLSMIKNNCKDKPRLMGIDPDRKAIELGRERFKDIHFVIGNDSDMVDGSIPLSKYDVLLLSDTCLLLNPEALSRVFAFAKDKVKHIVIMDDIVNIFGDFTVLRRIYFLHPYKKMLEANGFKIIDKTWVPNPNWANSGILTAERTK
jgi:hypothetical protein